MKDQLKLICDVKRWLDVHIRGKELDDKFKFLTQWSNIASDIEEFDLNLEELSQIYEISWSKLKWYLEEYSSINLISLNLPPRHEWFLQRRENHVQVVNQALSNLGKKVKTVKSILEEARKISKDPSIKLHTVRSILKNEFNMSYKWACWMNWDGDWPDVVENR